MYLSLLLIGINLIALSKNIRKLKIRTNNFCDKNGQILEDKKFSEDYLIISEIMHSLFIKWYGPEKGGEIKRSKIYLEQKDLIKSDNLTKSFRGFDKSENKYYFILSIRNKCLSLHQISKQDV